MAMIVYSFLLLLALVVSAPWWLWRMLTAGRYREGLGERLGQVPRAVRDATAGRDVIWVHAVSMGEVIAAEPMIRRLQQTLPAWVVAISTTTATGRRVAAERFPESPVFYLPLDFGFAMRRYLEALEPKLVVLIESELWPRMLVECERAGVSVTVVNARISDRSFPRYMALRGLWRPLLRTVAMFLAQGDESAGRLLKLGIAAERIRVVGNLKYDTPVKADEVTVAALKRYLPAESEFVVCGSTLEGEEREILEAWVKLMESGHRAVLMIAPRHPQRFDEVARLMGGNCTRMSRWMRDPKAIQANDILLLDTIGSLASVYRVATVAFVGGSLVAKGGHNPLEPARFGVPVIMGSSYGNFREMVEAMRAEEAIAIVEKGGLTLALHQAMTRGRAMGRRGKAFFDGMAGASERTVEALLELLPVAVAANIPRNARR